MQKLMPVTDNLPFLIQTFRGSERIAEEINVWPNHHKSKRFRQGSNSRPLDWYSDVLLIDLAAKYDRDETIICLEVYDNPFVLNLFMAFT